MKNPILTGLLSLLLSQAALASGTEYVMRVEGLACPYCAYGVEKRLEAIDGVEKVQVDLDKGLVTVGVKDGTELTEPQMRQLFQDAGFTFRRMTRKALE